MQTWQLSAEDMNVACQFMTLVVRNEVRCFNFCDSRFRTHLNFVLEMTVAVFLKFCQSIAYLKLKFRYTGKSNFRLS